MATFLMYGNYSAEAIRDISAERTGKAGEVIEKFGGGIISIYATLGDNDLLLIVDLPGVKQAMQASLALNKLTGISFSTVPAVGVEEFDELASME